MTALAAAVPGNALAATAAAPPIRDIAAGRPTHHARPMLSVGVMPLVIAHGVLPRLCFPARPLVAVSRKTQETVHAPGMGGSVGEKN